MDEASAQAQRENERLAHENETLKKEIEALRGQFAEAVKLANQFEETAKENDKHVENIQILNERIEDLSSRLKISVQSRVDLEESFNRERLEVNREFEQQIELLKQEISERNAQLLTMEKEWKQKLTEVEESKADVEMNLKKAQIELKQIYSNASQHFEEPIETLESLIEAFVRPQEVPITPEPVQEKKCSCAKRKQKIKRLQNQIRSLNESHLSEIRKLRAEFDQKEKTSNLKVQEIENTCDRLNDQCESMKQDKNKLVQEIAKLKTQLKCAAVEAETKRIDENLEKEQKIKKLSAQLIETDEKNDTLKKQLQPLMKKFKALQTTNKTQEQTLAAKDEEIRTLEGKISAISLELQETTTERDNLKGELTSLHKRFQELLTAAKEYKESLNETTVENRRLENSLVSTRNELESTKADLESVRKERDELAEIIENQNKVMRQNDVTKQEQKDLVEKLKVELENLKQRLVVAAQPINELSLIPLAVEATENLPEELAKILVDISTNPTLKAPTMLRQILTVMNEWYQSANHRTGSELDFQKQRNGEWEAGVSDLAQILMRAFPQLECNFDQILEDESVRRSIDSALRDLEMSLASEKETNSNLESSILNLLVEIGADDPCQARDVVSELKLQVERSQSQIDDVKTKLRSYQKLLKARQAEYEDEKQKLTATIKDTEAQLAKSNGECAELRSENTKLISENTAITERYEQALHERTLQAEEQMKESQASMAKLLEEVKLAKALRQKTEESKVEMEDQIQQMQNTIHHLNVGMDKKSEEAEKIKRKLNEVTGKARERIEAEREVIQRKSDKLVSHIQSQVTELTAQNAKLKQQNTRLEEKQETMRSENETLAMKLQASEMRIDSMEKDFEREKRLLHSQMKTQLRANENKYNQQLDELRLKLQEAKRNLIAFVANNFCALFDVKNVLDDSSFEPFIINIRTKLSSLLSLEANLRELLNLGPQQSIEDSVSSLLLEATR